MRCDGSHPCATCCSSGIDCHYPGLSTIPASAPPDIRPQAQATDDLEEHRQLGVDVQLDTSSEARLSGPPEPVAVLQAQAQGHSAFPGYEATSMELMMPSNEMLYLMPDGSGPLDDLWQMPDMNNAFWFDGPDLAPFDNPFDQTPQDFGHTVSSSVQHLTETMQEYFDRKSQTSSPSLSNAAQVSRRWYSSPPNLANHDKDILRVFLKLFRKHIPVTMPLFQDQSTTQGCSSAYVLAMAATGGMFCAVNGSTTVAKSMYNDARRLLLARFSIRDAPEQNTAQERLVLVKTFILLELYGLCSGDKRSYEFVEAFHGCLLHALQEYDHARRMSSYDPSMKDNDAHLIETLYILDCYHVIIMQRPPSLPWHHVNALLHSAPPTSRTSRLKQCVRQLSDGSALDSRLTSEFSLASLAALSPDLWPAAYPRQNRYDADDVVVESFSLWKPDRVEAACDNWLRSLGQSGTSNPSERAVYHMMNIMLHANMAVLQHFAHSAPDSGPRDAKKSATGKEVHAWIRSRHYTIALWHAENLIACVEGGFKTATVTAPAADPVPSAPRTALTNSKPRRLAYESPHVPYAVYYATLVTWCSFFAENTGAASPPNGRALIARGERVLCMLEVHVAQLLAHALSEVR